ncbi:acetyltransferase [Salmonella enterica subsp. enterica serovar Daytona]|uniref:Acetyltransferase n=1 Tax=Salmonella enterica subsp. enterica serovar Daytona TaxID=1962639 RepID=A0A447JBU1_SALET|nr:acetyltransferase [Salmonella enterica subsp. enterica serovar Daytona]
MKSIAGKGWRAQLVYEGLDSLNEFGYAAVVTLGDPALYSRFGFELAAHYDLHCRWPGTESAFQVHRLAEDALEGVTGLVEYHDHVQSFLSHRRLQAGQQRLKRFAFRHKALPSGRFVSCLMRYSMRRASERSPTCAAKRQR